MRASFWLASIAAPRSPAPKPLLFLAEQPERHAFNTTQRSHSWHRFRVALSILFEGMAVPLRQQRKPAAGGVSEKHGRDGVALRAADYSPHHEMRAIIFSDRLAVDGCETAWLDTAGIELVSDRRRARLQRTPLSRADPFVIEKEPGIGCFGATFAGTAILQHLPALCSVLLSRTSDSCRFTLEAEQALFYVR
ncbi:hypothetical protein QN222_14015 [Sinorhizobium sp. 6-70]|nr:MULTISPECIES: hypothetical protein [unclassified Sinorhizobium]MDK1375604.1 hypothetical protein [Sinorhizobium sp. 6-70]MDK1479497.1 hypothetical protein [Sinorhizobium sp. 6-117]